MFFGLGRKKSTTTTTTAPTTTTTTTASTSSSVASMFASGFSSMAIGSASENQPPAAKIAAIEKPGQLQPARRGLHDITNAGQQPRVCCF